MSSMTTLTNRETADSFLIDYIRQGLQQTAREIAEKITEEAAVKIGEQLNVVAFNLAVSATSLFSVEKFQNEIRITIKNDALRELDLLRKENEQETARTD
jgi:hypothetical protein